MKSETAELTLQSAIAKRKPSALMLGGLLFVAFFDTFTQLPLAAPYAESLGAQGFWIGFIFGTYSITNAVGNVFAGWILDHVGRKLPLCVGFLGAGTAVALYGTANSPEMLFVIRAIHGLLGGLLVPTVFTINADWAEKAEHRRASGRIGMSIGIAALVGPSLAGILGDRLGAPTVFVIVGVSLMLAGLWVTRWNFLDRSPEEREEAVLVQKAGKREPFVWTNEMLLTATIGALLLTSCLGSLTVVLPLELTAAGYSSAATGAAFSAFAVTAMLVMLLGNRLLNFATDGVNIGIGFAAISLAFMIFSVWPGLIGAIVAMAVFGMGFGVLFPPLNALVGDGNAASARGRSYGLFYAGFSGGFIVAPPVAGWLAETAGSSWVFVGLAMLALAATIRMWRSSLPRA